MKNIPKTKNSPVLRTDFSNDDAWRTLCAAIQAPFGEFRAYVDFIDDPEFDGLPVKQLLALISSDANPGFIFVVDHTTLAQPDFPILVVDLFTELGRTFRVIPAEMWAVENNLSIANMDFAEFADHTGADGVFRGFPEP